VISAFLYFNNLPTIRNKKSETKYKKKLFKLEIGIIIM
jgi:hypothetical protein